MPPMTGSFDATQFTPRQAGDAHPPGKFPANISNTTIQPTKANDGGMFVVEFTTPAGTISNRYNLWNSSPKAVEIANNELSALCYATGIFKLDFQNEGAALRGGRCMIDVAPQTDKEGKPTNYMEIKKVFDVNGNEPGKGQSQQQAAPMQQQGNGEWGNPPPQQQPPQNPSGAPSGGWGAPQAAPAQTAPQNQPAPASNQPAWGQSQPQQPNAQTPPWGR